MFAKHVEKKLGKKNSSVCTHEIQARKKITKHVEISCLQRTHANLVQKKQSKHYFFHCVSFQRGIAYVCTFISSKLALSQPSFSFSAIINILQHSPTMVKHAVSVRDYQRRRNRAQGRIKAANRRIKVGIIHPRNPKNRGGVRMNLGTRNRNIASSSSAPLIVPIPIIPILAIPIPIINNDDEIPVGVLMCDDDSVSVATSVTHIDEDSLPPYTPSAPDSPRHEPQPEPQPEPQLEPQPQPHSLACFKVTIGQLEDASVRNSEQPIPLTPFAVAIDHFDTVVKNQAQQLHELRGNNAFSICANSIHHAYLDPDSDLQRVVHTEATALHNECKSVRDAIEALAHKVTFASIKLGNIAEVQSDFNARVRFGRIAKSLAASVSALDAAYHAAELSVGVMPLL
jgi:hypothetical protein